jgi:SAM-dependent methyltransferase
MDVVDLREFYASALGKATRQILAPRLSRAIGPLRDQIVVGLGFAPPYFETLDAVDARLLAFMSGRQGVIQWPEGSRVASALVDEFELPLLESTADVVFIVHALEVSDSPVDLLREAWRVLAPQGRLVLVVPNRRGLWAGLDSSPFGQGQPYSRGQLAALLKEAQFSAQVWTYALRMPPSQREWVHKAAPAFERTGGWLGSRLSGVIIVEATKQVYAFSPGKRARRLVPRFAPALLPRPASVSRDLAGTSLGISVGNQ